MSGPQDEFGRRVSLFALLSYMSVLNKPPFPVFSVLPVSFEERWSNLACQSCRGPGFDPNKAGIRITGLKSPFRSSLVLIITLFSF